MIESSIWLIWSFRTDELINSLFLFSFFFDLKTTELFLKNDFFKNLVYTNTYFLAKQKTQTHWVCSRSWLEHTEMKCKQNKKKISLSLLKFDESEHSK